MRSPWAALGFAVVLAVAFGGAALAAETLATGPAPAWVKAVAPMASPAEDEAPVRILLSDQQVFVGDQENTVYNAMALRVQTSLGLSAGNLSFSWRPETDQMTVHKLLIRRGAEVIDVLASGQTFTIVRRETNLESAMLDGVLTANIQPEGLQVGDILEFAASTVSRDPVMQGHFEQVMAATSPLPLARSHLRVVWPQARPIRTRQAGDLPRLKISKIGGGLSELELSQDNLAPPVLPKGAPPRFQRGRVIELSDFASWAELGAMLAPLYETASRLPAEGPLRAELEKIRGATPSPAKRAEAALELVQERVRYVALTMGTGGLTPADAATTWARRYGDCKAKTALLLALLHALDIEAEPVAVSTVMGDGIDERLPMIGHFNHVLVRARIDGQTYWMDGTRRGDLRLSRLTVPDHGWGLPLVAKEAALVRMAPGPLAEPSETLVLRIDARAGLVAPASVEGEIVRRGDGVVELNTLISALNAEARDKALKAMWAARVTGLEATSTSTRFDPETGERTFAVKGTVRLDWRGEWYRPPGAGLGYTPDFARAPGPDQDAPFAMSHPTFVRRQVTIQLPPGAASVQAKDKAEVDEVVAQIEYKRSARIENGTFILEASQRSLAPELAAKDAPVAQARLKALSDNWVRLRRTDGYRPTDGDIAGLQATAMTDADDLLSRGGALLDRGRLDEALADFDRALAAEPKNAKVLASRGLTRVWKRQPDLAKADLDAALALDPGNAVAYRARGLMAEQDGAYAAAIAAYSTSLEYDPNNLFALEHRANAYRAANDAEAALRDLAAAIRQRPSAPDFYLGRANLLFGLGRREEVRKEVEALLAAAPDQAYAQVAAAKLLSAVDDRAGAMKAYDRALALAPEAYIYLNRADSRDPADLEGRRADIEAAIRLAPKEPAALAARGDLQEEAKDLKGAVATYTAAIALGPKDAGLVAKRGLLRLRAGETAGAAKDFAAARALAVDPVQLNALCWAKAIDGLALDEALTDCNAALAKAPKVSAFLDSRGLVNLRLGALDAALADYDASLAARPNQVSSLYGRALVWSRKGEAAKSEADAAAARRIDGEIDETFADYGLKL